LLDELFPGRSATPKVRSGASCARYSDALQTRDLLKLAARDDPGFASALRQRV